MIRCLSCRKSSDNPNLYKVKLISDTALDKMPVNGKDIVGITNSAIFDKGSEMIVCGNQTMYQYVYGEKGFISDDEESNNIDDNNPNSLRFVIDDDGAVYIG